MTTSIGQQTILLGGTLVDLMASVVIVYHVGWAILAIARRHGSDLARLRIARGVLMALGFSVAGTLLKIIALQTWTQIRSFAFVFVLRTLLKKVFAWEERSIESRTSATSLVTACSTKLTLPSASS